MRKAEKGRKALTGQTHANSTKKPHRQILSSSFLKSRRRKEKEDFFFSFPACLRHETERKKLEKYQDVTRGLSVTSILNKATFLNGKWLLFSFFLFLFLSFLLSFFLSFFLFLFLSFLPSFFLSFFLSTLS